MARCWFLIIVEINRHGPLDFVGSSSTLILTLKTNSVTLTVLAAHLSLGTLLMVASMFQMSSSFLWILWTARKLTAKVEAIVRFEISPPLLTKNNDYGGPQKVPVPLVAGYILVGWDHVIKQKNVLGYVNLSFRMYNFFSEILKLTIWSPHPVYFSNKDDNIHKYGSTKK